MKEKEGTERNFKITKEEVIGAGVIVLTFVMGCKYGSHRCDKRISKGIEMLWKTDPTLKDHMFDTLNTVYKNLPVK